MSLPGYLLFTVYNTNQHEKAMTVARTTARHAVRAATESVGRLPSTRLIVGPTSKTGVLTPRPLGKRPISTTSSVRAGFGSWLPSSSSAKRQEKVTPDALLAAVNAGDFGTARRSYESLLADTARSGSPTLDSGEVNLLLSDLSHKSDVRALALLKRVYGDLPTWGLDRNAQHARDMLRGMCTAGKVAEAYAFGDQMGLEVTQWREILSAATKHDASVVPLVLERIRPHGLIAKDYAKLFRSLRDTMPDDATAQLEGYLAEMREAGLEIKASEQQASLARLYIALGEVDAAIKIIAQWDMAKVRSLTMWNTRVEYQVAVGDVEAVKASLRRMREKGIAASQVARSFLVKQDIEAKIAHTPELRWTDVVSCITKVERETETKAQDWVWAEVINMIIDRTGDMDLASQVYDEARSMGVTVTSRIARAMIVALLDSQPVRLEKAMHVYAEFASDPITLGDHHTRTRVTAIYAMLLAACASKDRLDPAVPLRLLQDMRANDVQISGKLLSSLLVALINSAPDHDTAFNYYAHAYVAVPGAFDAEGYSAIAMAFLALSTEGSPFPPPNYVFELVKDMRTSGYQLSTHTLTRLLNTYGTRATPSRKSSTDPIYRQRKIDKIHRAISDVHVLINIGTLVVPDVPLLAALMDAYSRVGAYTSAFQVWDQLLERRQREDPEEVPTLYGPAVSTILDTCGRSDQSARATKIYNWAKRFNIVSPKVAESWVECLCRLGRFDEAAQIVCVQMKGSSTEDVKETARVLLKLSWRDKTAYRTIPDMVKAAWPGLWDELKEVVETKSQIQAGVDEDLDI